MKRNSRARSGIPLAALFVVTMMGCTVAPQGGDNWPRWMGPDGNGAVDVGLLPRGVQADFEFEWRRPIGDGYSSLTIFGDHIFTLEVDGDSVRVVSLDVADGTEIWSSSLPAPYSDEDTPVAAPSSTPATDGQRVFAIHPSGGLSALDAADGTVLWSRDLVADFGTETPPYGMSTSPVLAGNRLHVLVGGRGDNNFITFDPATGETLLGAGHARVGSYATPVFGSLGGVPQWVVPAGDRIYGVRSDSADVLWEYEGLSYPDRDPLLLAGDRVFLALQEYGAMLKVTGTPPQARELWRLERLSYSYSPAVLLDGAIYSHAGKRLTCVDASKGEILWEHDVGEGVLIRVDDHLVTYETMTGQLRLVEASRDGYLEISSLTVFPDGGTVTPPSFAAGRIYLRGDDQIAVVELRL